MRPDPSGMTFSQLVYEIAAFARRPKNDGVSPLEHGQATREDFERHYAVCDELDARVARLKAGSL